MWKVFLLFACVASLTIISCDDSSNDDIESSYRAIKTSSRQTKSSSLSSNSSSLSSSSSSSLSSSSLSSSSSSSSLSSETSLTKTTDYTSKKRGKVDTDDSSNSSSNESNDSAVIDTTTRGSADTNTSDESNSQSADNSEENSIPNNDYKCGPKEVFSNCTNGGCEARNCSQAGKSVRCVKLDPKNCIKGCVCATGYLRTSNGTCVPRNQCTEGCGDDPNAHPGCGVNCGATCSTYKSGPRFCPAICNLNGCDCNKGYVLDPVAKKCVLPEDCTPVCGSNEIASNCSNGGCGPWNCTDLGKPILCVRPIKCLKGCVCQNGYLRNNTGDCVPKDKCGDSCGGDPNAKPGCGVNCGRTCATYKAKNPICPRICKVNGCDCKDNYVFDSHVGKCVLPNNCTPTCGLNERYDACINGGCGYKNCSQLGQPQLCVDLVEGACIKGCTCSSGYLRAANGTCIPQDQCPAPNSCGGDPNAKPGCGVNCGRTCATYKAKNPVCPLICKVNGCDCKANYVFDSNVGKCVLPNNCTPTCGLNEQYNACINGGCGPKNCSQLGQPRVCVNLVAGACIKGCICSSGYLRAANGTCIPQDQCPAPRGCGGDPNAEPGCGYNCGKTCTTYKAKKPLCPRIPCKRNGCECKANYVFDSNLKKCVLPKDCTNCDKPNEVFDVCRAPCPPRRCDVDDSVIRCAAPPQPGDPACQPGCRCADNYARNATGTCVLRDQCEKPLTCDGPYEIYDSCPAPCPGQSCDVNPALVLCAPSPKYGDPACKPACRCIDGYARNAANECIPRDQCPSTDDQCSGQNEFFDTCIQGCSNQTCDTIGKRFNCPIQTTVCRTGCRCKPGFYRNSDNVCVAESECPTPSCPEGEIYSRCPTVKCEGDYCPKTRDSPLRCPVGIVCDPPRCVCGFNSHRDRNTGKCIATSQCPPFKCDGPNEVYKSCPAICPGENCTDYINNSTCPRFRIGIVVPCQPQCKCIEGYYRNSDGVCILGSDCGPKSTASPPIVVPLNTTTPQPTTAVNDITGDTKTELANLQAGITGFNGKFLYDRMKISNGENIITSPYSVFTPLAQLALYTDGESFKQLANVLNVPKKQAIRNAFPVLAKSYDGQTSVNFSTAAKVYSDKKYPLSAAFKKDSVNVVNADAQDVDFSKSTEAAATINAWVEGKTNNRIKDLIKPSDLSALTRLVLVNAIYFKGDWLYTFNKVNTKDADFYLSDGTTKKTKLMYQQGQFNYGEVPELNCTCLEMFYKGRNFSMVYVLPNKKYGVMKTAENLQNPENFNKVLKSMRSQKVKVYVPPFEISTSTDLAGILKQDGVTKIFDQNDSGLTGLLENTKEKTYVSKAIQKAFIKVDENGSEAAAANGVGVGRPRPGPPPPPVPVFRADHAFLYYLRLQSTIIFCGAFIQ